MTDWTIQQWAVFGFVFIMVHINYEKTMPIFWAVVAANIFLKAVFQ